MSTSKVVKPKSWSNLSFCLFSPIFYNIVIQHNTNSHLPTQANMKYQLSTLPRSMGTPTLLTGWSRLYAQQTPWATLIKFFIDFEYFSELVCWRFLVDCWGEEPSQIAGMLGGNIISPTFDKSCKTRFQSFRLTPRCTPLHNAAGKGFSEIVQLLVRAGANVHIRADKVTTMPLFLMLVQMVVL